VSTLGIVLLLVALQRGAELLYAARNTRALLGRGGVEFGGGHYWLIAFLHLSWLIALAVFVPWHAAPPWPLLGLFGILQALRIWVLASLGPHWTTRIIVLPGAPLVRRGPYRWVRHPNYLIVAAEIAVLPLAFGAWRIALVFSILNAAMLAWRIRTEDRALGRGAAPRAEFQPR
jgi:methyltransferase